MDKKLKQKVTQWVTKVGPEAAKKRLYLSGCSMRLAEQLIAGTYDKHLRSGTQWAIERAISA